MIFLLECISKDHKNMENDTGESWDDLQYICSVDHP